MMPISQLVVHEAHSFWVHLVRSDLPQKTGLKEGKKREEKGKVGKVKTVEEK